MKLIEAVDYLRKNILHDTGGHRVEYLEISEDDDDVVLLRWSNESLSDFINEAVNQVYRRILPAHGYYPDLDIPVLSGQSVYDLDSRILRVFSGRLTTSKRDLTPCDLQQLNKNGTNNDFLDDKGNPTSLIVDYTSEQIRIYPEPDTDENLILLVNRLPLKKLKWSTNVARIEMREEFQIQMLNYAAYLAYSKDEANSLDIQAAERRLAAFNAEFPATSAYSDTRKRRQTRRTVAYGGL